jgi:signal transduction histidine kinase
MLSHVAGGSEVFIAAERTKALTTIALERVGAALLVCDERGFVLGSSPAGDELLTRMGSARDNVQPTLLALPPELWSAITAQEVGEAALWRPGVDHDFILSCTRYRLGDDWLLVLSEISQKQSALAHRLHHQRLEGLGRVVATAVHDLRAPLSSIVFGIDVLARRDAELSRERTREIVSDVRSAAFCLRETIDCLLDFVRLGPPVPSEVSIRQVLTRMQSLLRPQLRVGPHELIVAIDGDVCVSGNLLTIEQIFVNLVVNSLEAGTRPKVVRVTTRVDDSDLLVLVEDDGPGIRADQRHLVFEPMFSTKPQGVGLGLTSARESARSLGGDLRLVRWNQGTAFEVSLPICSGASASTGVMGRGGSATEEAP